MKHRSFANYIDRFLVKRGGRFEGPEHNEPGPAKLPDVLFGVDNDVFRLKFTYKASDLPILADNRL